MLEEVVRECPWCSASLTPGQTVCASCGAHVTGDEGGEGEIPGVTEIDKSAVGVARPPAINTRSRWRAWISGDSSDALTASESKAVAPPDDAVRQEMLRLELQAQVARLQAETDALLAEAAEEGRTLDIPPELLSTAMADPTVVSESAERAEATEPTEPAGVTEASGSTGVTEPAEPAALTQTAVTQPGHAVEPPATPDAAAPGAETPS